MISISQDGFVLTERDLHPDNVLVEASGDLVLLDWDDTGPACPDRGAHRAPGVVARP